MGLDACLSTCFAGAAFVLEPNLGSALVKGAQGVVGSAIGAGLGIASQAVAQGIVGSYNYRVEPVALVS